MEGILDIPAGHGKKAIVSVNAAVSCMAGMKDPPIKDSLYPV